MYNLTTYTVQGHKAYQKHRKESRYFAVDNFMPGDCVEIIISDSKRYVEFLWFRILYIYEDNTFVGRCLTRPNNKSIPARIGRNKRINLFDSYAFLFKNTNTRYAVLLGGKLDMRNVTVERLTKNSYMSIKTSKEYSGKTDIADLIKVIVEENKKL